MSDLYLALSSIGDWRNDCYGSLLHIHDKIATKVSKKTMCVNWDITNHKSREQFLPYLYAQNIKIVCRRRCRR